MPDVPPTVKPTAQNPNGVVRPSPYGTKKLHIGNMEFDASADPDVEERGRQAAARLQAQTTDHQNKY